MTQENILVVDNDPIDRQVTAYILRELGEYQVCEATSGSEALQMAGSQDFDLVVLDVQLPGDLDGITLTERILRSHVNAQPSIMAVTAENDMVVLKRCASKGVMDYILKPYVPGVLLERAKRLLNATQKRHSAEQTKQKQTVADILKGIKELPTLPAVLTEIQDLAQDPNTTAETFGQTISLDLSITSKVLRMANSAFFGVRRKVTSIRDAITLLGFETVRNVALVTASFELLKGEPGTQAFDRLGFWLHSIGCGAIAKVLCGHLRIERSDYFTAGIMHDMGKVVLDAFFSEHFAGVVKVVKEEQIPIREAEKKVLGVTHAEIGRYVARRWKLPPELVEAIAFHHEPDKAEEDPQLVSLAHLSDIMARRLRVGSGGDPSVPEIHEFARETLGVTDEMLEEYVDEMNREIRVAQEMLPLGELS